MNETSKEDETKRAKEIYKEVPLPLPLHHTDFEFTDKIIQEAKPTKSLVSELLELTKEERAYRRGALQAIQFLVRMLQDCKCSEEAWKVISNWEQLLHKYRGDSHPRLQGTYLDTIMREMLNLPPKTHHGAY